MKTLWNHRSRTSREGERKTEGGGSSAGFRAGAVALAFLIIGYQASLFIHRAAVLRIESLRDRPDTVFVAVQEEPRDGSAGPVRDGEPQGRQGGGGPAGRGSNAREAASGSRAVPGAGRTSTRREAQHSAAVQHVRERTRRVESFRFDPNTASIEDFKRLGFSEKQALSIASYRNKGGRFRRPSDFARSYVVADSVFRRLEPYIDIPRTDINRADSAEFDALPGIGPYFAAKMVELRRRLGGYSHTGQLMDIYNFDRQRFDALKDLIYCSEPEPYDLWTLPADSLRLHPYIHTYSAARAIVLYRENTPELERSVQGIADAGILPPEDAARLLLCRIREP